jgi:hypothetical protein
MTITITPTELRKVFNTRLEDSSLAIFCQMAEDVVTEKLSATSLGDEKISRIGLFLAAHFASTNSPQLKSESIGPHRWERQGQTGLGLDATLYGQSVKVLDTTGTLAKLGLRVATVGVISLPDES